MEVEIPSFSSLLLPLLLFFTFILLFIKKNSSSKDLPPGPWRLPVIGNFHNLLGSRPYHRLHYLAEKYGPIIRLRLGEVTTIIVSTPELAKEIMKTHDSNFSNRPFNFAANIITYNKSDITFAPYSERWREMRKVCISEILSGKRVQIIKPIREEEMRNVMRSISSNEGSNVNFREILFAYNLNVLSRAAFGKIAKEHKANFVKYVQEMSELVDGFNIADLFPSIKFLYTLTGLKARAEKLNRGFDKIAEIIINDHKSKREMQNNNKFTHQEEADDDLVDVLLNLHAQQNLGFTFTMDNVKAVTLDIFNAGTEGPALVPEWIMSELMKNPRIMKKVQEEVRQVFDKKGYVDEEDLGKLNYMKSIIKENFRLHPPGALLVPRECQEECKINGYRIPKKSTVLINTWTIGRDPNYWNEPESFIPERFLDSRIDYKGTNFEFLPFGAGRRMCPGITFGMINVELPLANLLYHFDWKLPNGMKPNDLDMTEAPGIVVRRKNVLSLIPTVARPLPVVA